MLFFMTLSRLQTLCVIQYIHITKLGLLGIGRRVLSWMNVFLTNHSSSLQWKARAALKGLFLVKFPRDLSKVHCYALLPVSIVSNCKLFADGLKLYLIVTYNNSFSLVQDLSSCQYDTDQSCTAAVSRDFKLNSETQVVFWFQCGYITWNDVGHLSMYNINGEPIKAETSHNDLDVTLDTSLKFLISE